jgi:hypothetical protein
LLKSRAADGNTQLIVTTHSPILPDLIPDESLFVCQKISGRTQIKPFSTWGPLASATPARATDIGEALDREEDLLPVSQRMLRGDFDEP